MDGALADLTTLLAGGGVVVLSGAGLSTESGIPDYRGPERQGRPHTAMTFQEFLASPHGRRRYWARSHAGWGRFAAARPNTGHLAVARLAGLGLVPAVVTQNVDGLHQAAGAPSVLDLHGRLDRVRCLGCGRLGPRQEVAERLAAANPGWREAVRPAPVNPDGDVALPAEAVAAFRIVDCDGCGGLLKPDVVFFGESVPAYRVERAFAAVHAARAMLVLGSSLTVASGRRFVARAARLGLPVAIVNRGETRGDRYATIRLDAPLGVTLTALTGALAGEVTGGATGAPPGGEARTPAPVPTIAAAGRG